MKSPTPYDEVDAAIIARIRSGMARFYEIWPGIAPHLSRTKIDRLVDRRLQALRKKGKIGVQGQRWYVL